MGESFYTLLGVGDDADGDAIERAYRERVKKHHPDVSDTPGPREKFKRLTVARNTLVDGDERFRYDTMGHESYVKEHVRDGLFDVDGSGGNESDETTTGDTKTGTRAETTTEDGTATAEQAWVSATRAASSVATDGGEQWSASASPTGGSSTSSPSATDGIYDTSTTSHSDSVADSTVADLWETVWSFGPWLLVYLLAVVSVVTVAWPVFAGGVATSSAMVAVFVSVMIVVTIVGAALHFVSMLA